MKMSIRKGTWETNSSSTHAMVIKKETPLNLPKEIHFSLGQFGWEADKDNSTYMKASYLYTALYELYKNDPINFAKHMQRIEGILKENNIRTTWQTIDTNEYYYIDHGYNLEEFVEELLDNKQLLLSWLFDDDSFLVTDNDNDGMEYLYSHIDGYENNKDFYFYYKGN